MFKVALVANQDRGLEPRLPLANALRSAGLEVVFVCPFSDYQKNLETLGFRCIDWRLNRRSINAFREIKALFSLTTIYRREQFDAVQHFTIKPIVYGTIAARLSSMSKVINTFTGVGFPFLPEGPIPWVQPLFRPLLSRLLARNTTTTIFHNSNDQNQLVIRNIVPLENSAVILGSGVDTERFSPAQTVPHSQRPVVLMASRILTDKGVGEYVEAARWLRENGSHARFIHVGEYDVGSRMGVPLEVIESWKNEGVVEFLGYRSDMPQLLRNTAIAVLPSHHEGLPRYLAEAASCGVPLVATDIGGCKDVVHEGENGYLVPVNNPMALANAIDKLLSDPERRAEMGEASRHLAEKQFDINVITKQYVDVYHRIGLLP